MSITIFALAKSFQEKRLKADEFANCFMELWKYEGAHGLLTNDPESLNECLSSIFCLADLYNSDLDRYEYELDEDQLREQVAILLNKHLSEQVI